MKFKEGKRAKGLVSTRLISAVRQFATPFEFREGALNTSKSVDEEITGENRTIPSSGTEMTERAVDKFVNEELLKWEQFSADMGTALWRLRHKMVEPGSDQPLEEMRRAFRHFEAAWDLLSQMGVEIQEHTDRVFDTGMDLSVLTFQPMANLKSEMVVETILPSIYFNGRMIQRGEVIVGTPEKRE